MITLNDEIYSAFFDSCYRHWKYTKRSKASAWGTVALLGILNNNWYKTLLLKDLKKIIKFLKAFLQAVPGHSLAVLDIEETKNIIREDLGNTCRFFFLLFIFLYSVRSPLSQIDWPVDNFGRLDHIVDPYQAQDSIFFRLNFYYGFKNSSSQGLSKPH